MKVKLIGKTQIVSLTLPKKVYGNYWITNEKKDNLINIEAVNNKWIIKSNSEVKIMRDGEYVEATELVENHFYNFFDISTKTEYRVFVGATFDNKMLMLNFNETGDLTFYVGNASIEGKGHPCYISYENNNIAYNQIEIIRKNGIYYLKNLNLNTNVYVNNYLVNECYLKYGDVVFIEGLIFSFVGNMLLLGTVGTSVKYVTNRFYITQSRKMDYSSVENSEETLIEMYSANDYFVRPPRFSEIIETKEFTIDNPPGKQDSKSAPILLTLAPMLVMGMSSCMSGAVALINVASGKISFADNYPAILTAICMLLTMLAFPLASRAYESHISKGKEKERQEKYCAYTQRIENEIKEECVRQKRILIENNVSLKDVGDIIIYRKRNLWERKINHRDFLTLRLGIGDVKPDIKVNYPEEHFELDTDNLVEEVRNIVKRNDLLKDVPVVLSFKEKYISALIGKYPLLCRYMDGLILQMLANHSYDELKLVILSNDKNISYWEKLKNSPYCWNNDKTMRFFASSMEQASRISNYLEEEFQLRSQSDSDKSVESTKNKDVIYRPHYLFIIDDIALANKIGIVNDILTSKSSYGFSMIYLSEKLNILPSECSTFISIEPSIAGVFENELINKKQEFKPDFVATTIDTYIYGCSNIPIELGHKDFELPTTYTFLEMYDAGNVSQLNAFNKWQKNDPTTSLSCPVGIDENGDLFKLDLHEKMHGPHGLIAGMTGSGKSEFIISYILSMAVNFDPREVQFVLIDYKGGGLAGAFENKETGKKLPHLAGTITNLDINEINRSLSSLQSELKRRQRIFNEARDKCNESTIDIYKYQKLYREGKVEEPVAHLIIISDEFAELKAQQPDFMDELISTARIGRSLGVHLVLATQKPSGVVDEQIWSNSKFRVCLKVQDKNDSNDMLKNPDAAFIKETGRFYLQVGYNEFFAKGQAAWAGATYYETDKRKKTIDTSISFVNNVGEKIKDIDSDKNYLKGINKGEEIANILDYIEKIGEENNIKVKQLWLDAIDANIFVDKLKTKYNYQKEDFIINPVIGEYDAPLEQEQNILTVPFSKEGNLIIYGAVGSGKENLVSTIIYSLITTYTVNEVNIYVLDFGTEALKMYSKAPHIGGIVNSSDKDKLASLIKMLGKEIIKRKQLFSEYNGDYYTYCKKSGNTVPMIITIINNYESFNELYEDYADELILLTREGQKYGIVFILTVSAVNNIRMKLSQNFNEKLVLQMNDQFDYRQLLGRTDVTPMKYPGRGLVKRGGIYEFQSAYPTEMAELSTYIPNIISDLLQKESKKAQNIPTLPNVVTTGFVSYALSGLDHVPVGVSKDDLDIECVDIKNQGSLVVSANNLAVTKNFVNSIVYELKSLKGTAVYVIDADRLLDQSVTGVNYYTSAFDKVFTSFQNIVNNLEKIYIDSDYDNSALSKYGDMVFVIIGMNKLKTILADKFDSLVGQSIQKSKKLSKICYIFVDVVDNFKKLEYDNWYKDIVNSTRGIWIGNGLAEANIFKLTGSSRAISEEIPNNFGYNIASGVPTLIKYVESVDEEEEIL